MTENNGVIALSQALQNYFAPDAMDAAYQGVVYFPHFRKSIQTAREYSAELDLLRRKAGGQAQRGKAPPNASAAVACLRNANLPNREKSASLSGTHGKPGALGIAQQVRRIRAHW